MHKLTKVSNAEIYSHLLYATVSLYRSLCCSCIVYVSSGFQKNVRLMAL